MRVAVIPCDKGACGYLRLAWPAWAVAEQTDWQVEVYDPANVGLFSDGRLKGIPDPGSLDLVVMQRVISPHQVRLVKSLQNLGIAVVMDVDDLLSDIHRGNRSWSYWNAKVNGVPRWQNLDEATHLADVVTVATQPLANHYAKHGRSAVIRNGLPDHAFVDPELIRKQWEEAGDEVVLGWSGMIASHPDDLDVAAGAVRAAMDADPLLRFHVVGEPAEVATAMDLDPSRVTGTGLVLLENFHDALREVDIAIVPLADTRFNRAKSHLKALEFTAAGAFVLVSDLPEQRYLGAEMLAITVPQNEWLLMIQRLVASVRRDRRGAGDEMAMTSKQAQSWAITNRVSEWADAWARAVNRRRNLNN